MALETPIILAHNLFKNPSYLNADSNDADYPDTNLLDMTRHTKWKAAASGNHNIEVYNKNLVRNPGAELNTNYWVGEVISGSPTWTFSRNTTTPLKGDADFKLEITAAAGGVRARTAHSFDLKAGRTYVLTWLFKASTAASYQLGLLDSTGAAISGAWGSYTAYTYLTGDTLRFTPSQDYDGVYVAFWHYRQDALYFDAVHFNEARDIDTLIIDQGHNMQTMTVYAQYINNEFDSSWKNPTGGSVTLANNDAVMLKFTSLGASNVTHFWRFRVESSSSVIQQAPNVWLGESFTLPGNPERPFDPNSEVTVSTDIESPSGIRQSFTNYSKRTLNAKFNHLDPTTDAAGMIRFWEDTRRGSDPFWWVWRPTTDPKNLLYAKLKNPTLSIPYDPYYRSMKIEAEEVGGELAIQDGVL